MGKIEDYSDDGTVETRIDLRVLATLALAFEKQRQPPKTKSALVRDSLKLLARLLVDSGNTEEVRFTTTAKEILIKLYRRVEVSDRQHFQNLQHEDKILAMLQGPGIQTQVPRLHREEMEDIRQAKDTELQVVIYFRDHEPWKLEQNPKCIEILQKHGEWTSYHQKQWKDRMKSHGAVGAGPSTKPNDTVASTDNEVERGKRDREGLAREREGLSQLPKEMIVDLKKGE